MRYVFTDSQLKEFIESGEMSKILLDNFDNLKESSSFLGRLIEMKAALEDGSVYVDAFGHDEVNDEKGRIENKFTNYVKPNGSLRINNAGDRKRNGFDYIRIIDGVNKRIFLIPHDIYYSRAGFYGNEFHWSSSYNKTDKIQRNNTALLLEYEVTEN